VSQTATVASGGLKHVLLEALVDTCADTLELLLVFIVFAALGRRERLQLAHVALRESQTRLVGRLVSEAVLLGRLLLLFALFLLAQVQRAACGGEQRSGALRSRPRTRGRSPSKRRTVPVLSTNVPIVRDSSIPSNKFHKILDISREIRDARGGGEKESCRTFFFFVFFFITRLQIIQSKAGGD
jgi:hypothetical protein